MISSGREDWDAGIMGSEGGNAGILYDGRSYTIPPRGHPVVELDDFMVDVSSYFGDTTVKDVFAPHAPAEVERHVEYVPKPGGGYTRNCYIESSGSQDYILQVRGGSFTFVQGKESACIVSRDFLKDNEMGDSLPVVFTGLADPRLRSPTVCGGLKGHGDIDPSALVSVLVNLDDLNEEKGFKPDSSCKDPVSRFVNEEASINLLKQKLENGTINETIQESGSRFVNEEPSMKKQKLENGTINQTIQDHPGSRPDKEEASINLLKEKLQDGTINETIQSAISAFQSLCGKNFKAHEIEVYAIRDNKEGFLAEEEIERHLTVINNV